MIPQVLALVSVVFLISAVVRMLDWVLQSDTSAHVAPVECGFDSGANTVTNFRVLNFLSILVLFEAELILSVFLAIAGSIDIFAIMILVGFSVIEIVLAGK